MTVTIIAYGNGRFVAGGVDGKMAYSTDGITWTAVTNSAFGTSDISDIAYGDGRFVAVSHSGKMAYSTDNGITWTAILAGIGTRTSKFGTSNIYGIAYGNGRFVAGSVDGKMAYCKW